MKKTSKWLFEWIIPPIADETTPKPVRLWLLFHAETLFCAFHF